ncbi:MAG TPA: hypothetical protein VJL34_13545 [Anaerolineales bacterium]|nr:hypothetical protein [Anaerolineales bacterium]
MDSNLLKKIVAQIQRRYPEFAQSQPRVRLQKAPKSQHAGQEPSYLLTFHTQASAGVASERKSLPRWMRVVVSQKGKILKVTTSR